MGGYANRFIMLQFPELAEEGDEIWVQIRNPRIVPPGELSKRAPKPREDGEVDSEDALNATYEIFAKLIVNWRVYDATITTDDQPLLGRPADALLVAKLPLEILNRMGDELAKINPQKLTESPEATTSS